MCQFECENWEELLQKLNDSFDELTILLTAYLSKEENHNKQLLQYKIQSLKKFFNSKAFVINFNYTGIADRYGQPVYHPHGTTKENDIIIGYDNRGDEWGDTIDEPCVIEWPLMRRNKIIMRGQLEFKRKMKSLNTDPCVIKESLSDFIEYQIEEYSGIGLTDNKPSYEAIEHSLPLLVKENLRPIKRIIIIGHSLNSDIKYLSRLFLQCNHLKEFIIFYNSNEEKFEKIKILVRWLSNTSLNISKINVYFWQYDSMKKDKDIIIFKKYKWS